MSTAARPCSGVPSRVGGDQVSRVFRAQTEGPCFPGSSQESGDWKAWGRKAFRGRDSVGTGVA